jgi:hypothetical protein
MSINDEYINALLADAAYAKDLADGMSPAQLRDALKTSMTLPLADFISSNFTVASHIESGDLLEIGFDGTVWRGNAGTPYAGQVYVSMQGTLGLGDWLTDVDIAANGTALKQYETMVNWWLKISTPPNELAKQVAFVQGQGFVAAPSVAGTRQGEAFSSVFVNGNSLGGNLATGFARLFGGSVTINHVTSQDNTLDALLDLVRRLRARPSTNSTINDRANASNSEVSACAA